MGIVVKQTIRSTFNTYLDAIIDYINFSWLFPKFLEPDQFGLLRVLQDMRMLLAPFAALDLKTCILLFATSLMAGSYMLFLPLLF